MPEIDESELVDKRTRASMPNRKKMRNLKQYKDMTDEAFSDIFAKKLVNAETDKDFEDRIIRKITSFGEDYDLDDLNSNDKLILRALSQALLTLEDYETIEYRLRKDGIDLDNILVLDKISRMKSDLRSDISKMQDDLKITRRIRKSDKETTVLQMLEELKRKAKEFYEQRMSLIFCPKCNTLIASIWTLFPREEKNKFILICNREMEDGKICGERIIISSKELIENLGTNKIDIPESLK